jgi:hypothetical protein
LGGNFGKLRAVGGLNGRLSRRLEFKSFGEGEPDAFDGDPPWCPRRHEVEWEIERNLMRIWNGASSEAPG